MLRALAAACALVLVASGCGCGDTYTVPCSTDRDCSATERCLNGKCQPGGAAGGSGGGSATAGGNGGTAGGMMIEDGGRFDCNTARLTCMSQGFNCGPAGDGCGLQLDCGDCAMPETCGGGGVAGVCGMRVPCMPKTCAQLGANCGQQSDGCGGLTTNCGTCTMPEICGGAGVPSRCGAVLPDAGVDGGMRPCTNLCLQQSACDGGTRSSISGTVLAPTDPARFGAPDPLPGAFVYVPNGTVTPFTQGVQCEKCSASVSGDPLVSTTTAVNGTFTLTNVPCGQNIPLVIQLGRWRRQITIPNVACCGNTALTADQTRLPRRQAEGHANDNIPLFAVTTGSADNLECILPKIGIDQSEFTTPSGTGRVRLYRDNGVNPLGGVPAASTLYGSSTELAKYDVVLVDCVGLESDKSVAERGNLETYANTGGRVFTSHYGYVWLYNQPNNISFTSTASWQPEQASPANQDAFIDVTSMYGQRFGQWVYAVNAQAATSTVAQPKIRVNTVRRDFNAVVAPAERWVWGTPTGTGSAPEVPLQYAFNTPLAAPAADKCGRVLFSDFHVSSGGSFPTCTSGPLTPQEKVFEYLIFDLTSCVTPYTQTCTPLSCASLGLRCGPAGDGCGGTINCGMCQPPQTCGGGGMPGVCGGGCIPRTCAQLGYNCGPAGDGCGALLDCGTCPIGERCGVFAPGVCGPEIG